MFACRSDLDRHRRGTIVDTETRASARRVSATIKMKRHCLGGDTLTLTDITVAAGLAEIGDRRATHYLSKAFITDTMAEVHRRLYECVDRMKTDASLQPLLAVGGGAILAPDEMDGISEVVRVPHHGVANAVGAAMAQVSGEVDHVFRVSRMTASERPVTAVAAQIGNVKGFRCGVNFALSACGSRPRTRCWRNWRNWRNWRIGREIAQLCRLGWIILWKMTPCTVIEYR